MGNIADSDQSRRNRGYTVYRDLYVLVLNATFSIDETCLMVLGTYSSARVNCQSLVISGLSDDGISVSDCICLDPDVVMRKCT